MHVSFAHILNWDVSQPSDGDPLDRLNAFLCYCLLARLVFPKKGRVARKEAFPLVNGTSVRVIFGSSTSLMNTFDKYFFENAKKSYMEW